MLNQEERGIMFFKKTKPSLNPNKWADAYYALINKFSVESAIYLKNSIIMDDPNLDDPINKQLMENINCLMDKVTDLKLYKQRKNIH
jgi:hypothetical protein